MDFEGLRWFFFHSNLITDSLTGALIQIYSTSGLGIRGRGAGELKGVGGGGRVVSERVGGVCEMSRSSYNTEARPLSQCNEGGHISVLQFIKKNPPVTDIWT